MSHHDGRSSGALLLGRVGRAGVSMSDADGLRDIVEMMKREARAHQNVRDAEAREKHYRDWKRENMPRVSCPDLNAVQDFLRTCEPSERRDEAIEALERARTVNANLRVACKGLARVLFESG